MLAKFRQLATSGRRRVGWFVRDRFPNRTVVRTVQGVTMAMPWSHRLPDYASGTSIYGQNLVQLARLLGQAKPPLTVLDVGANVGDSALQILAAADARVLCVEADTAYLKYLHLNADDDDRISIVEALLTADDLGNERTAVRRGGTTRFVFGAGVDGMPNVTPDYLRRAFADFDDLRLVKSDTDGYDVALIPAIAETWADTRPILFFEYDPYLIRLAGLDPSAVWPRLAAQGYTDIGIWDNGGRALGRSSTATIGDAAHALDDAATHGRTRSRTYWDVAVVHGEDREGCAVLDLMLGPPQQGGAT